MKLIDHADSLSSMPLRKVLYCYGITTNRHHDLEKDDRFILHQGIPDIQIINEIHEMHGDGCLIILDDLAVELKKEADFLANLYSRISHHRCMPVITVLQNLFSVPRTARMNYSYLTIMKTTSDRNFIFSLGKQLFEDSKDRSFLEAYDDSTRKSFGYLFIDLSTRTDDNCRLVTDIFEKENISVYVPKSKG